MGMGGGVGSDEGAAGAATTPGIGFGRVSGTTLDTISSAIGRQEASKVVEGAGSFRPDRSSAAFGGELAGTGLWIKIIVGRAEYVDGASKLGKVGCRVGSGVSVTRPVRNQSIKLG